MTMARKPTFWSLPVTVAEIACFCWLVALPANVPNPNVAKIIIAKILDGTSRRRTGRRKFPVLMSSERMCRLRVGRVESHCGVPFSLFSENEALPDGSRPRVWFAFDDSRPLVFFEGEPCSRPRAWFAFDDSRPLVFFAGLRMRWEGERLTNHWR